jgi:hypothetical protein
LWVHDCKHDIDNNYAQNVAFVKVKFEEIAQNMLLVVTANLTRSHAARAKKTNERQYYEASNPG